MIFSKASVAVCGLATFANAHMRMSKPQPFAVPQVVNSPLSPDGSNFPCQITAGMTVSAGSASNVFALGSTQPLTFIGQATHGGGSCQVSLTYDVSPTKNSVWKVIHSIQGGCPAKNTPGNMGDDANAADPFTYSFPIPSNIPTGNATIAWSWLNKIGNREYYMNCAPVTLTGTSGDKANYDALPDMLVANLEAINGCTTTEGVDYKYPNPGSSVEDFASDLAYPNGACGPTASGGSSGSTPSSAAGSSAGSATQGGSESTSTSAPASGGVFVTVPTGGASSQTADPPASTTATTEASAAPSTTAAVSSAAAPTAAASSGSGSSGSSSGSGGSGTAGAKTAGTACSPEGQWLCLGTSYQQCGSGVWTPVMPLAAGTSCTAGEGSTINIVASGGKTKRVAQRFRG